MPRIRTIKPEFFTSDDVCALSPLARLLYVALWCEADREGRLVWQPRALKRRYLPDDDCNIEALTGELLQRGLVVLYGEGLAHVPTFAKHQHVNPREAASKLPPPVDDASGRIGDKSRDSGDKSRDSVDAQGGREGNRKGTGKEGEGTRDADRDATRARALPENWTPDEEDLAWAGTARPDLDRAALDAETERFRHHAEAHQRTAHRWGANWRLWVSKAHAGPRENRGAVDQSRESDIVWRARLKGYRPGRFWLEGDWGPRPEARSGCRVPAPLLAEWQAGQNGVRGGN